MTTKLEDTLASELYAVADGVHVPALPSLVLDEAPGRRTRLIAPLLVAAAVLLVAGVLTVLLRQQGGSAPEPAPSPSPPGQTISTADPTVPYVLDRQLWIGGSRVPGDWAYVESRGAVWFAQQDNGSWWAGGPGLDTAEIGAQLDQPPAISPNGRYIALVDLTSGEPVLTGFDTLPAGEGFGSAPISDLPASEDGVPIRVRAVTDEGDVILQGTETSLMWRAQFADQRTVIDLDDTAPDQVVLDGTAAGLVVVDGSDEAVDATSTAPYLASISAEGELTDEGSLPTYDDLAISPRGTWLAWSPASTLGGEVIAVPTLRAQPVAGGDEVVLTAPGGGGFANGSWTWEDEETFVAVLVPEGAADQAEASPVRCSVTVGACRALPRESAEVTSTFDARQTLDSVVAAAAEGDRDVLVDDAVIGDSQWDQLVGYAAGGAGSADPCRDNGEGTWDCEITFDADPATPYYAIVEPADNAYGWRVSYVGIGGA